jgi:hypothetical protein
MFREARTRGDGMPFLLLKNLIAAFSELGENTSQSFSDFEKLILQFLHFRFFFFFTSEKSLVRYMNKQVTLSLRWSTCLYSRSLEFETFIHIFSQFEKYLLLPWPLRAATGYFIEEKIVILERDILEIKSSSSAHINSQTFRMILLTYTSLWNSYRTSCITITTTHNHWRKYKLWNTCWWHVYRRSTNKRLINWKRKRKTMWCSKIEKR